MGMWVQVPPWALLSLNNNKILFKTQEVNRSYQFMNTVNCKLNNGESLNFHICNFGGNWLSVGGIYVFSYLAKNGWFPLYVGQTEDFSTRLPNHERKSEAIKRGATHVLAVRVPLAANRDKYEKLLIVQLQPPMNEQYRNVGIKTLLGS
jgi:hypothetical protein